MYVVLGCVGLLLFMFYVLVGQKSVEKEKYAEAFIEGMWGMFFGVFSLLSFLVAL